MIRRFPISASTLAAAVALSLAVAIALERFNISEDGFEGLLLLVAAFFVVTMIFWMNRIARHLKKEIEEKVESYAARAGSAAGWGLGMRSGQISVRREWPQEGPASPRR